MKSYEDLVSVICPLFSNLGMALLGRVLGERFGNGAGYEGWIKSNLFDTFEMTDTSFVLDDR